MKSRFALHNLCVCLLLMALLIVALPATAADDKSKSLQKQVSAVKEVLASEGLSEPSIDKVTAGYESLAGSPGLNVAPKPEWHFHNNRLRGGKAYLNKQLEASRTLAGSAYASPTKKALSLYHFGKAIHAAQDFYFNSNYIELMLSRKRTLRPVNWTCMPTGIKTGYSWWKTALNNESTLGRSVIVRNLTSFHKKNGKKLLFHSHEQWQVRQKSQTYRSALAYSLNPWHDLLNIELTKERPDSIQGSIRVSSGRYAGRTLHQLASTLARKETARQWKNFCIAIKQKYGERAGLILPALTGHPLPTLQLSIDTKNRIRTGSLLKGQVLVTIKNASSPLSVDVLAKLSGKDSARYVLKNKRAGSYRIDLLSKLPIVATKTGDVRLSLLASFRADPEFQPVKQDQMLFVSDSQSRNHPR